MLTVTASKASDIVVSPSDCGSDDQPCIQAAVDKAASTTGRVILLPGEYTLAESVKLRSGVSILGNSLVVLIPAAWTSSSALLLHAHQVRDIVVEGIVLDGGGQDFPSEAAMVILNSTKNVVFRGVTLQHSRGSAIVLYSDTSGRSENNGIERSRIIDIGNHWRTSKRPLDRFVGLSFYDESPFANGGNFAIGNFFQDIGGDAIQSAGQDSLLISQNFFELETDQRQILKAGDFSAAMFIETTFDITIKDNYIRGAAGNCIDMPGVIGAVIERNFITDCGQAGIGVFRDYDFDKQNSAELAIRDNIIINNAIWPDSWWRAGITIAHGSPENIDISGNIITDTRAKGKKTQDYGIEIVNDRANDIRTVVVGLNVANTNRLDGNQRGSKNF